MEPEQSAHTHLVRSRVAGFELYYLRRYSRHRRRRQLHSTHLPRRMVASTNLRPSYVACVVTFWPVHTSIDAISTASDSSSHPRPASNAPALEELTQTSPFWPGPGCNVPKRVEPSRFVSGGLAMSADRVCCRLPWRGGRTTGHKDRCQRSGNCNGSTVRRRWGRRFGRRRCGDDCFRGVVCGQHVSRAHPEQ